MKDKEKPRRDRDRSPASHARDGVHMPQLAFHNKEFLNSRTARTLRILAEYIEPEQRFAEQDVRDTIVFFGSARIMPREQALAALEKARKIDEDVEGAELQLEMSRYYEDTRELAKRLTTWSKNLHAPGRRFVVCSGGGPGIMEAANRGASEARGINIGLNIQLPFEQHANPYITRALNFDFHYFFMRKFWFAYLAKAMVCMPGGFGTLDELTEMLTLAQTLKVKKKLPIVLYGASFWREVIDLNALVKYGTISREDLDRVFRTDSVDEAFEFLTRELQHLIGDEPTVTAPAREDPANGS
ncbi:MAG: LOG family protein [Gemmatimonas sp.]